MKEVKQTMDEVKNFMWDLREGMGIPVIRRKIQRLSSLSLLQQGEGNRNEQSSPTGGQNGVSEHTSNSKNSPNTCGMKNSDNVALPSPTLLKTRFSEGNLMPIRTAVSNLINANAGSVKNKTVETDEISEEEKKQILEEKEQEKAFGLR